MGCARGKKGELDMGRTPLVIRDVARVAGRNDRLKAVAMVCEG